MLGFQVKAFTLLLLVLLVVDAAAFQGAYRQAAGEKIGHFFAAVTPARWHGLGQGRDWSAPKPPRHD
ncbi:MAG: hypothetical protein QOG13_2063 [Sphingomonadales bacterium]|jgi:hypothetical protein|nr:hypothetical protein [Sphingomonadales bacterium]MEA3045440.1 hypothetical protein [Sphingomonadales bacterium]